MTSTELLTWVDRHYASDGTLSDSLGDSYLYTHNPAFRFVRERALEAGVRFGAERDSVGRLYDIAPLLSLGTLLETGRVPYHSNMDELEMLAKRLQANWPDVKPFISRNHVLHESAHAIADRVLRTALWRPSGYLSEHDQLLVGIYGEAFANTVEALGNLYVLNEMHYELYDLNSYNCLHPNSPASALLQTCLKSFGMQHLFELGFWIFAYLNLRPGSDAPTNGYLSLAYREIFGSAQPDSAQGFLPGAGGVLFGIDPRFRQATSPRYFKLIGLERQFSDVGRLDFTCAETVSALGIGSIARTLSSFCAAWLEPPPKAPGSPESFSPFEAGRMFDSTVFTVSPQISMIELTDRLMVLDLADGSLSTMTGPAAKLLSMLRRTHSQRELLLAADLEAGDLHTLLMHIEGKGWISAVGRNPEASSVVQYGPLHPQQNHGSEAQL
jgi:hypothetical protein